MQFEILAKWTRCLEQIQDLPSAENLVQDGLVSKILHALADVASAPCGSMAVGILVNGRRGRETHLHKSSSPLPTVS